MGEVTRSETLRDRPVRGFPLSVFILRYFLYVLAGTVALAFAILTVFSILISSGVVLTADHGERNLATLEQTLKDRTIIDDAMIPSSYHWLQVAADGTVIAGDMPESERAYIIERVTTGDNATAQTFAQNTTIITLDDGSSLALSYQIVPQFASKELRDSLPNPQQILLISFVILFIITTLLIALRAARVLSRNMQPLIEAAHNIENKDLEFEVSHSTIREINAILTSMDDMRLSLKESLEAQWRSEQAQREQIAALAHDLKTPLTIIKGNNDLLLESSLAKTQREYVDYIAEGTRDLEKYVTILIELSRSLEGYRLNRQRVDVDVFIRQIRQSASSLARISNVNVEVTQSNLFDEASFDPELLERAVMNIVSNAIDHSPRDGIVSIDFSVDSLNSNEITSITRSDEPETHRLIIRICDQGKGFSSDDLIHATERFYRGDPSRSVGNHFGMGLSIARSIIESHEGTIELTSVHDAHGAKVVITLPLLSE